MKMKNTKLSEIRVALIASCLVFAIAIQTLNAQTTIDAIFGGNTPVTNIYDAEAWPDGTVLPVSNDVNIWSTAYKLGISKTPYTFYGGTLNIATGGTINMNGGSKNLYLNKLTLNGGIFQNQAGVDAIVDLQNNVFELNSGSLKTYGGINPATISKNLLFQNCSLVGDGTISIAQIQPGAYYCNVEFLNTVNMTSFTGRFEVVPGLSGTAVGGTLKLNELETGTFGVSVLAANSSVGITSNSAIGYYKSSVNGKLYFTSETGTVKLTSLNLGGTEIAAGTYTYSDFANYGPSHVNLQSFLNSGCTGTVTVTGKVMPPTNVTGGALVRFSDFQNSSISYYTVTPDDVTTSTAGTPVLGSKSPIAIPGLIKNHSYTFTVTATNTFGVTSEASIASSPVVISEPNAPIIGKAYTSGISGTAYIAFKAPISDGNAPITSYNVTSTPAGGSGTFTDKVGNGIITVTGLQNNIPYTFTITATNAFGTSLSSVTSNSVTVNPTTFVAPAKIIQVSNPTTTTNQLTSGSLTIGVTNLGGGVINKVTIPGVGDIMDVESKSYGRCGQSAIRDRSHGGKYNPTQAGFNETLGSPCKIEQSTDKIIVQPRAVSLWHGDSGYDFTRWENIGADPYNEPSFFGGALNASDQDELDEENIAVDINGSIYTKQEAEVYSEWDYYGTYEDYIGKAGIATSAIRHYFEYRFVRNPGHCINQFRAGSFSWTSSALRANLSHLNPSGVFAGTDKDMNSMVVEWHIRHDRSKWAPKYSYFRTTDNKWFISPADSSANAPSNSDGLVFILAETNNPATGNALAIYRPKTEINQFPVVGVNETSGAIVYKDDRVVLSTDSFRIYKDMLRIPTMSKYGFTGTLSGMINRTRLEPNVYETFRNEYLIFYGTPNQIKAAIAAYDAGSQTGVTTAVSDKANEFQIRADQNSKSLIIKLNDSKKAIIKIYDPFGRLLFSDIKMTDTFTIRKNEIRTEGFLLVEVNGVTKKAILY
jgi:hypothetical protein